MPAPRSAIDSADRPGHAPQPHRHLAAVARVLDRVVDQVQQHQRHRVLVHAHRRQVAFDLGAQPQLLLLQPVAEHVERALDDLVQVTFREVVAGLAALDAGEVEHVVDEVRRAAPPRG